MTKTPEEVFRARFGRRRFLGAGLAVAGAGLASSFPRVSLAASKVVKLAMNIPMTGDYAPWGLPGLYGCQIVAKNINAAGGVKIGGDHYIIEMVAYDHGYDTEKAVQGYKKLVLQDDAKMVMMLGGSTVAAVMPFANRRKMLTTTLLPSDITPDTPTLVATCESHPLYNVTGVEWLAAKNPDAKTAVIITTNDIEYGKQSAATYRAAFEVAGIKVLDTNFHGFDVVDFAPIVSSLLANKPDVFCMATDVYTTPIVEQLYHQGYKGKIVSCTLDGYPDVIAKTSKEFLDAIMATHLETPTPWETFGRQFLAIQSFDTYERLSQVRAPTLLVHGDRDILIPPENAEILRQRIPGSQARIVPGAAHCFFWEKPGESAGAIVEFL